MTVSSTAVRVDAAVRLDSVSRTYGSGGGLVRALVEVSVSFERGSFTAVMGPSGSGKSTLLQLAAGLDRPTQGEVFLGSQSLSRLRERRLAAVRREHIGFIFQSFNLLDALSAEQNVALPSRLAGRRVPMSEVREVLRRVGLGDRMRQRPSQLSGGQQQRVALARALVGQPEVIFADEPTGALDLRSGRTILALLRELVDSGGNTIAMVTHDPAAAAAADRVVFLCDGRLAGEMWQPSAVEVAAHLNRLET